MQSYGRNQPVTSDRSAGFLTVLQLQNQSPIPGTPGCGEPGEEARTADPALTQELFLAISEVTATGCADLPSQHLAWPLAQSRH